MKTKEFLKNFEVDRKAKKPRAVPKSKPVTFEAVTGDGERFDSATNYFYFDQSAREVRQTNGLGLRPLDGVWLGSMGYRIVKFENLRTNKTDAISDGQTFFRNEIEQIEKQIERLELEKVGTTWN